MKLTLSFKNLIPAITLTRVDFLGNELKEDLHQGRLNVAQDRITLQLELLAADVNEMVVKLLKDTGASASWALTHGKRYLAGCIITFPSVAGYGGSHVVDYHVPRYNELATIVFKRSPLRFDSDGRLEARTWTICHDSKSGKVWDNSVSVNENDPDPHPDDADLV